MRKWFGWGRSAETTRTERPLDPGQDLKIRARRRLIGAVTLVLTAVIVVPMLLDSEPRPLEQNIPVDIPAKNAPFTPKLEPVTPVAKAPAMNDTSTPPTDPAPGVPSETPKAEPTKVEPAKVESPKVESPKVEPSKAQPAKIEAPKTELPKAEPNKSRSDDGAQAQALLEGKPAAAATPSKGKYSVQIAAYRTMEQAQPWVKKLKAAGLPAYTEKVKTNAGERIRVRIGPYANQAEADKALARVKALGASEARVVTP